MSQTPLPQTRDATATRPLRSVLSLLSALAGCALALALLLHIATWTPTDARLRDSTPGALALWVAAQSGEEAPHSLLGQLAGELARREGESRLPEDRVLAWSRSLLLLTAGLHLAAGLAATISFFWPVPVRRPALILVLMLTLSWLFILPPGEQFETFALILPGGLAFLLALMLAPGPATKTLGFVLIVATLLLGIETLKLFATTNNYRITLPLEPRRYTSLPNLDSALTALATSELDAVLADRRVFREILAPYPADPDIDPATTAWPTLRYLTRLDRNEALLGILPVTPRFPGRLALATRADGPLTSLQQLQGIRTGVVAGDFAETRYLAQERNLVLLDMKILNDVNLPHLQQIAKALLQPARRNGPLLLLRILLDAARHTWSEALLGFLIGAGLGFVLGTVFAHFRALERGLLPYVVASQTVPILAIAPMIVIWLGAGPLSVAVISAYLTFFPVTINTLRGLRSPHPNAFELMSSWAASRWQIMWKLRFQSTLPWLFTALKVSATASVVGAIIGELPSSIRNGLGRAILDFSSDYSAISTPKLWGAILVAASLGIFSFLLINLAEWLVLGRRKGRA